MNKILPFIIGLAMPLAMHAQNHSVQLQSGAFTPSPGITQTHAGGEEVAGRYYRFIQFSAIPNSAERKALETKGIRLLQYIPNNTYIASIAAGTNLAAIDANIRSVFPIAPGHKLNELLAKKEYPKWALRGNGTIELTVLLQGDITLQQAEPVLRSQGASIIHLLHELNGFRLVANIAGINAIAALPHVSFIEPADPEPTPENLVGRTDHRSNALTASYSSGLHYDGTGVKLALNDDGIIGPHIDYKGRIVGTYINNNNGDHGDHCAGTIFGGGNRLATTRGMAFGAQLGVYGVGGSFANNYQAFDSISSHYFSVGTRITSTSYADGNNTGYTSRARLMDLQITGYPELMHVFSSGNEGTSNFGYGAGAGWGNVTGGAKQAKNVMTVGNVTYVDVLANSSSRGPAKDGRIKPDVCAVGTNVNSTIDPHTYDEKTGTSMSCPGVAGTLAQLYHAYKDLNGGANPNSALVKAAVLNTADDLGNAGPDFKHGWGRINARRAYGVLAAGQYLIDSIDQGNNNTHTIAVPANVAELRVMVYWNDKAAAANVTKALVNNLDATITTPSAQTVLPWVLDKTANATALNTAAVQGVDTLNNMEQVTITAPAAGNYTLNISGFSVPEGPQPYAVVYEFVQDTLMLTYPVGGESLAPANQETIRWDAYGSNGTFTLEYSDNGGANWTNIATGISATQRHYNWTPPTGVTGKGLIRITRGTQTDISDTVFSVIGIPGNLLVNWVCVDSMQISYTSVAGATGYIVTMLGSNYMDSVAFSATTTCVIHMNTSTSGWYSVQAVGPDGCTGRRALAQQYVSAPFNCSLSADLALIAHLSPSTESVLYCQGNGVSAGVSIQIQNTSTNLAGNIPLRYQVNGGAVFSGTYIPPISPGATAIYTFPQSVLFNTPGIHTIKVWTEYTADPNASNDTLVWTRAVINPQVMNLPVYQDFETFTLCDTTADCELGDCQLAAGWMNEYNITDDSSDWRTHAGLTPTGAQGGATGPTVDHNPGTATGQYLYLEASACYGREANLISPCLDLTTALNPEMSFAYHMYGADIAELHVDVLEGMQWHKDVVPAIVGDQGDAWHTVTVPLDAYIGDIVTVRFRGITGNGEKGDIAIDDIAIAENTGSGVEGIFGKGNVTLFPNPSKSAFHLNITEQQQPVVMTITDVSGKTIETQTLRPANGTISATIELTEEPAGVYFLSVTAPHGTLNRKLVKL